ncbi:MAG: DUF4037 domain-containing protein [Clostridia bacterium]|nr:DUF4037 domain-containing protein [Clostridia bacterium]
MAQFIKGMTLCEGFFFECAQPIIRKYFPQLIYTAGLIGYGSDVLGYDDAVSTDHMWGPRFYLFLRQEDLVLKARLFEVLGEHLPYTYRGYSTNFTPPDPHDNGVRHPAPMTEGKVEPLIFVQTWESYLAEQLGTADIDGMDAAAWLALSEHRLLSLVSGRLFVDDLGCARDIDKLREYPREVRLYLIASSWEAIASEQAFVTRCGACGDEIGARIIAARMVERLMRLCFLYLGIYAPYSKWFGTAFSRLAVSEELKQTLERVLRASCVEEREALLLRAQLLVVDLHNESGLGERVTCCPQDYYGRKIRVIYAERLVEATLCAMKDSPLSHLPLIGSMSQAGGLSSFSDEPKNYPRIADLYATR